MKKAIVTGAAGFIGSHLVKALSENGTEVFAVVRDHSPKSETLLHLKNVKVINCSLSGIKGLGSLIPERDVDVFYHLAWEGVSGPARADYDIQLLNAKYACDALLAAENIHCGKFVFASSISARETCAMMRSRRKMPPSSIYGAAKAAADSMAKALASQLNISYMSALISNVYGEGDGSPRFINSAIRRILAGERLSCTEGLQVYDFIHIADGARALCCLGEKGKRDREYYIGSQNPGPLRDFINELREALCPEAEIGFGDIPFGGISLNYHEEMDISALCRDTGFVAEISFREGILRTAEWIKKSGSGKNSNG